MNDNLPKLLAARLREPLPGSRIGSRFVPEPDDVRRWQIPSDARPAAVLILLYPRENRWHLPLTLRRADLPEHPGQVCLPGGRIEPGESSREAALREFREEVGDDTGTIELLGRLSPIHVSASNYAIEPWVGVSHGTPQFAANPAEVAEIFEVPLSCLLDPANFATHHRVLNGESYAAPHFRWRSHRVWGATCAILGDLFTLLEGDEFVTVHGSNHE